MTVSVILNIDFAFGRQNVEPITRSNSMRLVPQSCRTRLQPRDFKFIANVLTGTRAAETDAIFDLMSDPDSLNSLLDHKQLWNAILHLKHPVTITPELYFYVLVRQALLEAGIDHLELADYVAATLADHAMGASGQAGELPLNDAFYHVDFIEAMHSASPAEQFYLHVRCGNQFMVLTGLFPRFIAHREERRGAPGVRYYEGVARDSFRTAGSHPLASEFELNEVYQLLAEEFPQTRKVLNRLAQEYLFLGA